MNLEQLYAELYEEKVKATTLTESEEATVEEINAKAEKIKALKAKITVAEQLEADEKEEIENKISKGEMKKIEDGKEVDKMNNKERYSEVFYNALRGKALTVEDQALITEVNNALSSATGEDGGYLIPVDQKTAIKELKRQMKSLETLVNVEPVSTLSGSRNIEKDAEYTPFTTFAEGEDVPASDSPQFVNIPYTITDRGGILPVPNNLFADNTANLKGYLNKWMAKKQVATRNKLIVDLLNTLAKTAIADIDDVKNILNVQLDPAIADMSIVVMNQDSFNIFDKMKDNDNNYLLEKDPQDPTRKLLAGKPIYVFSKKTLPTRDDAGTLKAPVVIGSLKEAITLFDREQMSLLATTIGGTAFGKNRTEIRAITREDVKTVDTDAVVFGEIVVQ